MEIVNAKASVLTNFEVKKFLQEQKDEQKQQKGRKDKKKINKRLLTVTLETLTWLDSTPARVQVTKISTG